MKQQDLNVQTREESGKGASIRLRATGMVPAVFYGSSTNSLSISVDNKELSTILSGEGGRSTFFNLTFEGGKADNKMGVIKEIQIDPVTDRLIHVDFFELLMDRKMTAMIPVRLTGKAAGVEMGGNLQPIRRELEVSCLPKDLPDFIEIDVTELGLGESIHVDEVKLPEGVEAPHDVNFTIAVLLAKRGADEAETEAEGEEGEAAEAAEATETTE